MYDSPAHMDGGERSVRSTRRKTIYLALCLGVAALFMMQLAQLQALILIFVLISTALLTGYFLKKIDMTL